MNHVSQGTSASVFRQQVGGELMRPSERASLSHRIPVVYVECTESVEKIRHNQFVKSRVFVQKLCLQ